MIWRRNTPTVRKQRRFCPSLEPLECRAVPAVTFTPFTDPSGAAGLRILGDNTDNTVQITDDSTAGTTTVVADGVTHNFAQQFADFDIRLFGGNDNLLFDPVGDYHARQLSLQGALGN